MLSTPVSPDGKPGDTRSKWQRGEAAAERVRQDLEGERHRGGGRELAHVEEMSSKRSRWGGAREDRAHLRGRRAVSAQGADDGQAQACCRGVGGSVITEGTYMFIPPAACQPQVLTANRPVPVEPGPGFGTEAAFEAITQRFPVPAAPETQREGVRNSPALEPEPSGAPFNGPWRGPTPSVFAERFPR